MSFLGHEPKREMGIGTRILLAPVGLLLLLLFLVFGLPVMAVIAAKDALSFRAFRRREAGNVYFICTSRRGWHDLLKNNVIPVLPDRFRVVWTRRAGGTHPPDLYNLQLLPPIWNRR